MGQQVNYKTNRKRLWPLDMSTVYFWVEPPHSLFCPVILSSRNLLSGLFTPSLVLSHNNNKCAWVHGCTHVPWPRASPRPSLYLARLYVWFSLSSEMLSLYILILVFCLVLGFACLVCLDCLFTVAGIKLKPHVVNCRET